MDIAELGFVEPLGRACLNCGIVKFFVEFLYNGCPNCEKYMKFKNNSDKVEHYTTDTFYDLIMLPEGFVNWQTRFKHVDHFAIGLYAYYMVGRIPYRFMFELQSEDRDGESGERCL